MAETSKFPELIFGLVGPLGVDMERMQVHLTNALAAVRYETHAIRATDLMRQLDVGISVDDTGNPLKHYESRIDYANAVRERCGNNAALAALVIERIRAKREEINLEADVSAPEGTSLSDISLHQRAFIVRQFKRKEEIDLMRRVYGRKFIQVSAEVSASHRVKVLSRKLEARNAALGKKLCDKYASKLVDRDLYERTKEHGQRIGDVFHLGDVFVDASSDENMERDIGRFIKAFFGWNRISPTRDEYGAYIAASASLRTLDTSRQVGAAIFTRHGEVVSLGSNEVPKAGGGTYWEGDESRHRDVDEGHDANSTQKRRILHDFLSRLQKAGIVPASRPMEEVYSAASKSDEVSDSLLMDITEFGRMTHAEMNAITDAARLGKATLGTVMYVTTFPCHNCAKHIVASGISRVVYIEPYPKSMAPELHYDSIVVDGADPAMVCFQHFRGISPRRFRDIFEKREERRDDQGTVKDWYENEPTPLVEDRGGFHVFNEPSAILSTLEAVAAELGLTEASSSNDTAETGNPSSTPPP